MFLFSGFCFGDSSSAVEKGSWVTKNAIYICGQKEMSTPETTGAVSHFFKPDTAAMGAQTAACCSRYFAGQSFAKEFIRLGLFSHFIT